MQREKRRSIGERLRDARLFAKLTQQDVATDFLCSRQAVSSWESGKTLPTLVEFRELVTLYGVSSDVILFGADVQDECEAVLRKMGQDFAPSGFCG
jgi:transcriptional regulator with XRE-family HTH domain